MHRLLALLDIKKFKFNTRNSLPRNEPYVPEPPPACEIAYRVVFWERVGWLQ